MQTAALTSFTGQARGVCITAPETDRPQGIKLVKVQNKPESQPHCSVSGCFKTDYECCVVKIQNGHPVKDLGRRISDRHIRLNKI